MLFYPSQTRIEIQNHASVLAVALSGELPLSHSCGGMGSCGTCRIFVKSSLKNLSPRTEVEQEMCESRQFLPHERLACQLEPIADLIVEIPHQRT